MYKSANSLASFISCLVVFISLECAAQTRENHVSTREMTHPIVTKHSQTRKLANLVIDNQPNYIRFSVQAVDVAKTRLAERPYMESVEEKLLNYLAAPKRVPNSPDQVDIDSVKKEVLYLSSNEYGLVNSEYHSVINALSTAYSDHRPIVISPDVIWLMIVQGFSIHVNENHEKLRHYFVNFEGKKDLNFKADKNSDLRSLFFWTKVLGDFKKQIGEHVGADLTELVAGRYSTTGLNEDLAYNVALMNSMSSYFTYSMSILCGIPEIKLEGTTEDWKEIERRLGQLGKYELGWWVDKLKPVIHEIVKTRSGEVNQEFWANIFQLNVVPDGGCSTITYLTGWILEFFPYLNKGAGYMINPLLGKTVVPAPEAVSATNQSKNELNSRTNTSAGNRRQIIRLTRPKGFVVKFGDIPSGFAKVDLLVVKKDNSYENFNLFSGFLGVSQERSTNALRPEIAWGVVDTNRAPSEEQIKSYVDANHKK